jgi:hypothetical protein
MIQRMKFVGSVWNGPDRLIFARHFKYAIDRIAQAQGSPGTAPQMGGDQHIGSDAWAFWHKCIGSQFELNDSGAHAACRNASK